MFRFHNLVVCLVAIVAAAGGAFAEDAAPSEEGFRPLFDGKSLAGWDGDPTFWRVEDGAITGETTAEHPTDKNTFLIWRGGELDDFELRLEYRLTNHNSGVQYRSWEEPGWVVGGYQADMVVDSADAPWSGILYEERGRGILAKRGEKVVIGADHKPQVVGSVGDPDELLSAVKNGEWNSYTITARGNHLTHAINGRATMDATDDDPAQRRRGGILALQLHVGPPMKVQFRAIRLKRLPMEDKKKIVFVASPRSHDFGSHENNAGCLLLAKCLRENVPRAHVVVSRDGWPKDSSALDNADALIVLADGAQANPILGRLDEVGRLVERGGGVAMLHWATGVPNGEPADKLRDWIGGVFEPFWSVNPFWTAQFTSLPDHPITRGVKPFALEDEWYYNIRFLKNRDAVTPILVAIPPDKTRKGPDGQYSGNEYVRSRLGKPEYVAWARVRPNGARGFGFTGGHWHVNWLDDNFRKLVLNAIVWVAKIDVPADGVPSKRPTRQEIEANQDEPKPAGYDESRLEALLAK
ncbi:MAG: DUF1080 domain-containing protein [Pirellulales bacterium]|nr:DUF1080 domain-containing protein [Pirellulales bacterium]